MKICVNFTEQVLGRADPYIVVPYGSLEESPGGIAMQAVSDQPFSEITDTSGEWTYHKVQWVDMDKDGTLDALACRVRDSRNSGKFMLFLKLIFKIKLTYY